MDRSSKVNTETLEESDGKRNKIALNFKRPSGEKSPSGQFTIKSLYQNNCPICMAYKIPLKLDTAFLATLFNQSCNTQMYSVAEGPGMFPFYEGTVF